MCEFDVFRAEMTIRTVFRGLELKRSRSSLKLEFGGGIDGKAPKSMFRRIHKSADTSLKQCSFRQGFILDESDGRPMSRSLQCCCVHRALP
jgi:hypothetical protein